MSFYKIKMALVTLITSLSVSLSISQNYDFEISIQETGMQTVSDIEYLDNSIFAVGYSFNTGYTGQMKRFDTLGNEMWSKNLLFNGLSNSQIIGIEKVIDETNFYISGFISSTGINYNFISKIDSAGDTIWVNISNEQGFYALTRSMIQLRDKSIYSVGWRQTMTGRDAVVWRVDSLGQTIWKKYYTFNSTEGFDITEMLDGSLIVTGRNDGDNLILKLDFDGNLIQDTTITGQGNGTINHMAASVLPGNQLLLVCDSWNGSWYDGQKVIFNEELEDTWNVFSSESFIDDFRINSDSTFYLENFILPDSSIFNLYDFNLNKANFFNLPNDGAIRAINSILSNKNSMFVAGTKSIGNDDDYWLAKISGVGEEWIPDRCAYQPPIAGFEFEYNYPVLTLRDTSSGGLKYLDTVYSWQWTTSVGASGTDDSLLVFFDTAINKTIDIELVIGNWYGCTDTVNQTLVLGESGLELLQNLDVKVYPNPTSDNLTVQLDSYSEDVLFSLYDLQGSLQLQQILESDITTISLSKLPQGLYIYDVKSEGRVSRGKIIKR